MMLLLLKVTEAMTLAKQRTVEKMTALVKSTERQQTSVTIAKTPEQPIVLLMMKTWTSNGQQSEGGRSLQQKSSGSLLQYPFQCLSSAYA